MLRFLSVRHLAVIDHLEIEFGAGLNILTGETGAGKSMLVEALDLLTGGRASADLVRTGEDLAVVQAIFEHPDGREVIVRREVSSQGRSRAFIDDTLATTSALRELGASLVALHGQHEHQALFDPAEHRRLLDRFARLTDDVAAVAEQYRAWRDASAALERTRLDERDKAARIDLASFHLAEIDRVNPVSGEDEQLAAERLLLANADRLTRLSAEAYGALYEGEHAALSSLGIVWRRLGELEALDPRFAPYAEHREETRTRLEDLAFFLRSYATGLEFSPERLQQVEDRLASLERLKKKHGPALEEVLTRRSTLQEELDALQANDARAAKLAETAEAASAAFRKGAMALSMARQRAAGDLSRQLETALSSLAMPKSRVELRVTQTGEIASWSAAGLDHVEFFLSPNPGEDVRPLARIASGGELSRVMLALRTLAGDAEAGETLIFDEVDAGIGGIAADAVGARLQRLGARSQVLCITHLPQIAARADAHFAIAKQVIGGRTVTSLSRLEGQSQELEVGRMIAGVSVSEGVVASARELIASRARGETKTKGESETIRMAKAKGRRGGT